MGPFRGIGSNKKEARNVASSKAIDFIFQKLAPFRKQWEFYHKADLPENFNLSKPDPVSTLFFIDLDSCTSIAPKIIQLCRTLQLQRVSCIGFANKLYNGSSLPKDIFVERAESTSKSSAAFILAYRAGIFAVKHRSVSWKPFIVLVSKDHGLTCVAQMLENNHFQVCFCSDLDQLNALRDKLLQVNRQFAEAHGGGGGGGRTSSDCPTL